ncbi:waprin-Phi1-like [Hyla sarda]|uniref:waprin-Phi1-like n=1 Tax=Hyla sarda TaxID=327740 RepID=UPI0024C46649|nr:waprin-Phi1-like [Hyla sarda]XP_056417830.1 waprin-Phi1-like [Hyla sarda]XP_056417840.1 waprin-Phi1-like [Hyla sarda]XP_056417847.1 waprin-Phi1-like [Hyla sarda]XP_056417857.1 waprin-Phi1-like [Hyla sarda]
MTCNKLFLTTFLVLWIGVFSVPAFTENTKPGLCPRPETFIRSTGPCDNSCSKDDDCLGHMKCCDTRCGYKCVYAERPGFCPFNDLPHEAGMTKRPKCSSDFDCRKNAKCCERGSSKDCLPALKEKPGVCPNFCDPKSQLKCSTDKDCPANLKCCPNCGHTCVVSVKVRHAVPAK